MCSYPDCLLTFAAVSVVGVTVETLAGFLFRPCRLASFFLRTVREDSTTISSNTGTNAAEIVKMFIWLPIFPIVKVKLSLL